MKKKLFVYMLFVAMVGGVAYAQQTDDQENPEEDGGITPKCSMTVVCRDENGLEESRISCSGTDCAKGKTWVACNGKYWDC